MVITGRTRNAFAFTGTRVRIPPSPPHRRRKFHIACGDFLFYKLPRLQFFITSRFRLFAICFRNLLFRATPFLNLFKRNYVSKKNALNNSKKLSRFNVRQLLLFIEIMTDLFYSIIYLPIKFSTVFQ